MNEVIGLIFMFIKEVVGGSVDLLFWFLWVDGLLSI